MMRTTVTAASALLALAACGDGQTGEDYRGEPLMSLRGVVSSSESALSQDLVPALSFMSMTELAMSMGQAHTTHWVKGEVEGTFPSSFTMRIYQPPAADALEAMFEGEPSFGFGNITAVSPAHPDWLRKQTSYESIFENGVEVGNAQREELCADTGECISKSWTECEVVDGEQQDPNAEWPCGPSFPDELPWEAYGYSRDYTVIYVDGAVAAGSVLSKMLGDGSSLASGYHLLRYRDLASLSAEELQVRDECDANARMMAFDATNSIYGTNAVFPDLGELVEIDRQLELGRQTMIAQAALDCPSMVTVVDTETEPIDLPFTDTPQNFTW